MASASKIIAPSIHLRKTPQLHRGVTRIFPTGATFPAGRAVFPVKGTRLLVHRSLRSVTVGQRLYFFPDRGTAAPYPSGPPLLPHGGFAIFVSWSSCASFSSLILGFIPSVSSFFNSFCHTSRIKGVRSIGNIICLILKSPYNIIQSNYFRKEIFLLYWSLRIGEGYFGYSGCNSRGHSKMFAWYFRLTSWGISNVHEVVLLWTCTASFIACKTAFHKVANFRYLPLDVTELGKFIRSVRCLYTSPAVAAKFSVCFN